MKPKSQMFFYKIDFTLHHRRIINKKYGIQLSNRFIIFVW